MSDAILLDTHAAIWFAANSLDAASIERLISAALGDGILVSPVTAWEVGLLARSPSRLAVLGLEAGALDWWESLLAEPRIRQCKFDGSIAVASTTLPGSFHPDPADRFLVATARLLDCALMTRDEAILDYAAQGHVKVIPC